MAALYYAVTCGDALHIIPADGHELADGGDLVVHGRENHTYGPDDWDVVVWETTREALMDRLERTRIAPRLSE
jgi:hypothetical protein